jgi:hypothetical protein
MARALAANRSIDEILRRAVEQVVGNVLDAIQGAVSAAPRAKGSRGGREAGRRRRPATREMTRWIADNRARRVPTFVIEATGLDTKKKIVARFGENATFELGKPLPAIRSPAARAAAGSAAGEPTPKRAAKRARAKKAAAAA